MIEVLLQGFFGGIIMTLLIWGYNYLKKYIPKSEEKTIEQYLKEHHENQNKRQNSSKSS